MNLKFGNPKNETRISLVFADYKGAFEAVTKSNVLNSISHLHLRKLVNSILMREIWIGDNKICYKAKKSIPQGSVLSPFLFIRANSQLINHAKKLFEKHNLSTKITGFADDNVLTCLTSERQLSIEIFIKSCLKFGFEFETSKTELLVPNNTKNQPNKNSTSLKVKDRKGNLQIVNQKNSTKWLGYQIVFHDKELTINCEGHLQSNCNRFKAATSKLSLPNKSKVYKTYLEPIFLGFTIFERVEHVESKIHDWIGYNNSKKSFDIMNNFAKRILKIENLNDNELAQKLREIRNPNWISLKTKIIRRLLNNYEE